MPYTPMTNERWMQTVVEHRHDLAELITNYHPASRTSVRPFMPITAADPETACVVVRDEIARKESSKAAPVDRFVAAVAAQDVEEIYSLLSSAWFGVPESTSCWGIAGFAIACDLMDDPPMPPTADGETGNGIDLDDEVAF